MLTEVIAMGGINITGELEGVRDRREEWESGGEVGSGYFDGG